MNVLVYELIYRVVGTFRFPIGYVFGPHEKLYAVIRSIASPPGRALDLGCGDGRDAIFLSNLGYDVTAVDFSPAAIRLARKNGRKAGVEVNFVNDDVTALPRVQGFFDLILDIGAFNDIDDEGRDAYVESVLPHTAPSCDYLLMCFKRKLQPGELRSRFGKYFTIDNMAAQLGERPGGGIGLFHMRRI